MRGNGVPALSSWRGKSPRVSAPIQQAGSCFWVSDGCSETVEPGRGFEREGRGKVGMGGLVVRWVCHGRVGNEERSGSALQTGWVVKYSFARAGGAPPRLIHDLICSFNLQRLLSCPVIFGSSVPTRPKIPPPQTPTKWPLRSVPPRTYRPTYLICLPAHRCPATP